MSDKVCEAYRRGRQDGLVAGYGEGRDDEAQGESLAAWMKDYEDQGCPCGDEGAAARRGLLRALDMSCPTCTYPSRETVGMVCQTCGADYGPTS